MRETRAVRWPLEEVAPAKINLTLRVLGRRADGYHELDSLVAFLDVGERVVMSPAATNTVSFTGTQACLIDPDENLVSAALSGFAATFGDDLPDLSIAVKKEIPVAGGLGGGSANAAATLRMLALLTGRRSDQPDLLELAKRLGADVPVCLVGSCSRMTGIGERVTTLPPPHLHAVVVNCGVAVQTAPVFAELGLSPGTLAARPTTSPSDSRGVEDEIVGGRNDLEDSARRIAPDIDPVLSSIAATQGCLAARMTGSGATCFGLYRTADDARAGHDAISRAHPSWWVRAGKLT